MFHSLYMRKTKMLKNFSKTFDIKIWIYMDSLLTYYLNQTFGASARYVKENENGIMLLIEIECTRNVWEH